MGDAADDVYNTQHGNFPGGARLEEYLTPPNDPGLYGPCDLGVFCEHGHCYNEKKY
jgi:hypothetical protein